MGYRKADIPAMIRLFKAARKRIKSDECRGLCSALHDAARYNDEENNRTYYLCTALVGDMLRWHTWFEDWFLNNNYLHISWPDREWKRYRLNWKALRLRWIDKIIADLKSYQ